MRKNIKFKKNNNKLDSERGEKLDPKEMQRET